jgi:hypothetical protein
MTRRLIGFLALLALTPPACGGGGSPKGPAGPPSPAAEPRTYAMGWGLTPPEPTEESIIATAQAMAEVAEYAIIQQPVPWARLFAGEELDDLVAESEGLARFLEALGLEIVFLLDPLDGLDRTSEPPELVEAGRSMLEPEIRAIHEAYALAIAREIRPAYFGLASEINTLAARGRLRWLCSPRWESLTASSSRSLPMPFGRRFFRGLWGPDNGRFETIRPKRPPRRACPRSPS